MFMIFFAGDKEWVVQPTDTVEKTGPAITVYVMETELDDATQTPAREPEPEKVT